jgi:hypothetical protein
MTKKIKPRCWLYPKPWQDPVCKAGSDVSGTTNESYICSEEYSETCPWAREWENEDP